MTAQVNGISIASSPVTYSCRISCCRLVKHKICQQYQFRLHSIID